jgi:hypothetical protein
MSHGGCSCLHPEKPQIACPPPDCGGDPQALTRCRLMAASASDVLMSFFSEHGLDGQLRDLWPNHIGRDTLLYHYFPMTGSMKTRFSAKCLKRPLEAQMGD